MDAEGLRRDVVALLRGGGAHMPFEDAVAAFPTDRCDEPPPNVPYTPWRLLEHVRLTQRDILLYITSDAYAEPAWPDAYWPAPDARTHGAAWEETLAGFRADLAELVALASDPALDLTAPLPHGRPHTYLRELLLVADHNAYHVGELAILRQVMGAWPPGREE